MEEKLSKRLDEAIRIYDDKAVKLTQNFDAFIKEMLTDDIMNMIATIVDVKGSDTYEMTIQSKSDTPYPTITKYIISINIYKRVTIADAQHRHVEGCYSFRPSLIGGDYQHDDNILRRLKDFTKQLNNCQHWFEILQDNACQVITDICEKYKSITEKQANMLDDIFAMLDVKANPTKHVKVTVEWI